MENIGKFNIYGLYRCEKGYCNTFPARRNTECLGVIDDDIHPFLHNKIYSSTFFVNNNTRYLAITDDAFLQISSLTKSRIQQYEDFPWENCPLSHSVKNDFLVHKFKLYLVPKGYYKDSVDLDTLVCSVTDLTKYKGLTLESNFLTIFLKFPNTWPKNLNDRKRQVPLLFFQRFTASTYKEWLFYFTSIKVRGQKSYTWFKKHLNQNAKCSIREEYTTEKFDEDEREIELVDLNGGVYTNDMYVNVAKDIELSVVPINNKSSKKKNDFDYDLKNTKIVAYDTETCSHSGYVRPYLVHFYSDALKINKSLYNNKKLKCVCKTLFPTDCKECQVGNVFIESADFLVDIIHQIWQENNRCLILVGFNNYKFDNTLYLGEALTKYLPISLIVGKYRFGFDSFTIETNENARNNKTNSWVTKICFANKDERVNKEETFKNTFTIIVKDCVTFIPDRTLAQACQDYSVTNAKIDIDIVKTNTLFEQTNEFFETSDHELQYFFKEKLSARERIALQKEYSKDKKTLIRKLICYYCEMDTKATYELFIKVLENIDKIIEMTPKVNNILKNSCLYYLSIPNFGFEIYKELLDSNSSNYVLNLPWKLRHKIEESCFGGRCDYTIIGEYKTNKQLCYIDVTSEYPLAMLGYFPIFESLSDIIQGVNIDLPYHQKIIDLATLNREQAFVNKNLSQPLPWDFPMSFFCCNFTPPQDKTRLISFGPIAYREKDKLYYTNNKQTNRYLNSIQIRLLVYCGWHVELIESEFNLVFKKKAQIFKNFIDFTGKLKTEAREENKTLAKLLKLIMNSIAGKLGQKSYHDLKKCKVKFASKYNTFNKCIKEYKNIDSKAQLHFLASFVWSYANQILFSTMFLLNEKLINEKKTLNEKTGALLYCDTDSIVFDKSMTSPVKFNISEQLGTFDTETLEFEPTWKIKYEAFDNLIVACKKVYACVDNGKLLTKKAKGIHGKDADLWCNLDWYRQLLKDHVSEPISISSLTKQSNNINTPDAYSLFTLVSCQVEKKLRIRADQCFQIENHNLANKELNQDVIFSVSRLDTVEEETEPINNNVKSDFQQFLDNCQVNAEKRELKRKKEQYESSRKRRTPLGITGKRGLTRLSTNYGN